MPAANQNRCSAAPPPCNSLRLFHTPTPAVIANRPKKTPVISSHSTPESFTKGPHTALPKRELPSRTPAVVVAACLRTRTTCRTARAPAPPCMPGGSISGRTGSAARRTVPDVLPGVLGFGAAAASAAFTSARAASRAPAPNALPNRTRSILQSLIGATPPRYLNQRACILAIGYFTPPSGVSPHEKSNFPSGRRLVRPWLLLSPPFARASAGRPNL